MVHLDSTLLREYHASLPDCLLAFLDLSVVALHDLQVDLVGVLSVFFAIELRLLVFVVFRVEFDEPLFHPLEVVSVVVTRCW